MFLEKIRQKNSLMYLKKSVFRDFLRCQRVYFSVFFLYSFEYAK